MAEIYALERIMANPTDSDDRVNSLLRVYEQLNEIEKAKFQQNVVAKTLSVRSNTSHK